VLPVLERQGLEFALIAIIALIAAVLRRRSWMVSRAVLGRMAGLSLLFFAVPAVLLERAKDYASETNVAVIFALTPAAVVLTASVMQSEERGMRSLIPALSGFAGVLLLLPFELPASSRTWVPVAELSVAMLLVAWAGVKLYRLLREVSLLEALAVVGSANAITLLSWCTVRRSFDWRWQEATQGAPVGWIAGLITTALTVWLLRVMQPVRFSARFLVIPLVTIAEGIVLLRPEVSGRTLAGLILLCAGTGWLVVADEQVRNEVLTLR